MKSILRDIFNMVLSFICCVIAMRYLWLGEFAMAVVALGAAQAWVMASERSGGDL